MNCRRLSDDEYAYLALLLKCIDARNWGILEQLLRSRPAKFVSVAQEVSQLSELNGMTILHACIRFNPPVRIVNLIINLDPSSPSRVDCLNRTPLHIAAGTRAKLQSVMILINACRDACAVQDADGKTPLHFACQVECELFEGNGGISRAPPSMDVVRYLALVSPATVPLEDVEGMSALEYAILSNADIQVVKLLMHITQTQCAANSSNAKLESLHDISRNLEASLPVGMGQIGQIGRSKTYEAEQFALSESTRSFFTI